MIKVICPCGTIAKITVDMAKQALASLCFPDGTTAFSFGAHVADPRAFVIRYMNHIGWRWRGVPLGKSTITMICPACRSDLTVVDDVDP